MATPRDYLPEISDETIIEIAATLSGDNPLNWLLSYEMSQGWISEYSLVKFVCSGTYRPIAIDRLTEMVDDEIFERLPFIEQRRGNVLFSDTNLYRIKSKYRKETSHGPAIGKTH